MGRFLPPAAWLLGAAGLLLAPFWARTQGAPGAGPTAATLKRDLRQVAAYDYNATPNLDIDSLADKVARRVVTYLKAHAVSAAAATQLGLSLSATTPDASQLRVYTFSYASGGTRGEVDIPVLQWQNAAGQRFAYHLDEECAFSEIHRLAVPGRALYLLLGQEKGDSQCDNSEAYVVELKGNYLLLNNAAFGKQPSFRVCNVPMDFDAARQALRLDLTDYSSEHDEKLLPEWGRPTGKAMTLKLRNGHFVVSR